MTAQANVPAGAPCWIDLMTSDAARSRDFYCQLFGWTAGDSAAEFGGYFMFFKDGVPVAGAMPNAPSLDTADQWGIYLAVDDVHKTLAASRAGGAAVRVDAMDVADLGTSAVITDPGGARIGLWQAKTFAGFGVQAEANAPGWFELHTRAYDTAVAFYRDVFGWDVYTASDAPQFRYTTLGGEDQARAGIMDATGMLPDAVAARWSVYFGTDDTDATLARITGLGGSVVMPAEDTPHGRLAGVTDPSGVEFKLVGPNAAGPGAAPSS